MRWHLKACGDVAVEQDVGCALLGNAGHCCDKDFNGVFVEDATVHDYRVRDLPFVSGKIYFKSASGTWRCACYVAWCCEFNQSVKVRTSWILIEISMICCGML